MKTKFSLREWSDNHLLGRDLLLTVVCIGAFLLICWLTPLGVAIQTELASVRAVLYGSASAICAALLGFIITTVTIIISLVQQVPRLEKFRKGKLHIQLHDVFFAAIKIMAIGTIGYLVLLFIDTDAHPFLLGEALALWLAVLVAVRLWRCLWVLEALVRASGDPAS